MVPLWNTDHWPEYALSGWYTTPLPCALRREWGYLGKLTYHRLPGGRVEELSPDYLPETEPEYKARRQAWWKANKKSD